MENQTEIKYMIVNPYKSVAGALLLGLFFGAIGLLYSSFKWGLIMMILAVVLLLIPKFGFFLFLLNWISCPFIAVRFCEKYNLRLQALYNTRK